MNSMDNRIHQLLNQVVSEQTLPDLIDRGLHLLGSYVKGDPRMVAAGQVVALRAGSLTVNCCLHSTFWAALPTGPAPEPPTDPSSSAPEPDCAGSIELSQSAKQMEHQLARRGRGINRFVETL